MSGLVEWDDDGCDVTELDISRDALHAKIAQSGQYCPLRLCQCASRVSRGPASV